jgi:hypothetical protein
MRFIAIPTYGERWLLDDEHEEATLVLGDYPGQPVRAFRTVAYATALDVIDLARCRGRAVIEQEA